jgi:hypothetical protein
MNAKNAFHALRDRSHAIARCAIRVVVATVIAFGLTTPALAGSPNQLLAMPIKLTVVTDPPAAVAPTVTGAFTYAVSCLQSGNNAAPTFTTPALTLNAAATLTPFTPPLSGTATASSRAYASGACTVTQTARPTPPAGYLWASAAPVVTPTSYAGFPNAGGSSNITVTAPDTNVSDTLVPALPITIIIQPPGAGSVTCVDNPVRYGDRSVCTVTENGVYTVQSVTGCNGGSDGSYYTDNLTAPCTITATFQAPTTPITTIVTPPGSGTLVCTDNPVVTGDTSSCAAVPGTGYRLVNIAGCGGTTATVSPMVTGAVNAACDVTATFALNTYPVTATANPTIAGAVSCTSPVNHGATSTCSITSTTGGYTFTGWTSTCGAAASTAGYTTGAVTAACTVTAAFSLNSYPVTAVASPTGAGVVSCTTPVNHGATSTCSLTSTTGGYTFTGWTSACGAAASTAGYTTGTVTAACTVTATFSLNSYPVTAVASPTGAGVVSCTTPVNHGATSTCSITSTTAGYTFTGWTSACGAAASTAGYTTGTVTAACTVTATFSLNSYSITTQVLPAGSGTLSCVPNPISHGAQALCTANPGPGYQLAQSSANSEQAKVVVGGAAITGCGGVPSNMLSFTTGNVTAPCTVTVNFVAQGFIVTGVAVTALGGAVTCASPVAFNGTSLCTAVANPGYTLLSLSGCGGVATTTSPFTTGSVQTACTVTGIFAALPASPVPTVSRWVLMLFALLAAALGGTTLGRRQR